MSTFSIFIALIIVVCFLLVLVVMVQNPKGGGLSSSFGGGTQQVGGVQKTSDFLDRSTLDFSHAFTGFNFNFKCNPLLWRRCLGFQTPSRRNPTAEYS
jgi:protein translocase SecG subunit